MGLLDCHSRENHAAPRSPGWSLSRSLVHFCECLGLPCTGSMNTSPHLENANIGPLARGRSRRAFLRMLVAGSGVSALGSLAAACGPAAPSAPATTTAAKPTVAAVTAGTPTPAAAAAQADGTGGQI